jgi:hypothetical protein
MGHRPTQEDEKRATEVCLALSGHDFSRALIQSQGQHPKFTVGRMFFDRSVPGFPARSTGPVHVCAFP